MADMVLITNVNDLPGIQQAHGHATKLRRITKVAAPIFYGTSVITPEAKDQRTGEPLTTTEAAALVEDKRVVVVDDGPTLTMAYGAGYVMAKNLGADEIEDPRPFAKGSLVETFKKFPHTKNVLPAMGYDNEQVHDLQETIRATKCDTVVIGTPIDLGALINPCDKASVVAQYNLAVVPEHVEGFDKALDSFYERYYRTHHHAA